MTIETLYRVQCQPCERYLTPEGWSIAATVNSYNSPLFLSFTSAYNEAVKRGWSLYPLLCPDCAADLKAKVQDRALLDREDLQTSLQQLRNGQVEPALTLEEEKVRNGEVHPEGNPPEDRRGLPEGDQGAQ